MEEAANYQHVTNSQTAIHRVYEKEIRRWRGLDVAYGLPFESDFTVALPTTDPHSFRASHNETTWFLEVTGVTQRHQDIVRRFPLAVLPAGLRQSSEIGNATNAANVPEVKV